MKSIVTYLYEEILQAPQPIPFRLPNEILNYAKKDPEYANEVRINVDNMKKMALIRRKTFKPTLPTNEPLPQQ